MLITKIALIIAIYRTQQKKNMKTHKTKKIVKEIVFDYS